MGQPILLHFLASFFVFPASFSPTPEEMGGYPLPLWIKLSGPELGPSNGQLPSRGW